MLHNCFVHASYKLKEARSFRFDISQTSELTCLVKCAPSTEIIQPFEQHYALLTNKIESSEMGSLNLLPVLIMTLND